jgi:hypothetical protein
MANNEIIEDLIVAEEILQLIRKRQSWLCTAAGKNLREHNSQI